MSARTDLRLTPQRLLVLMLMLMLDDPEREWHGYEIMKRLTLLPGTVYPILRTFTTAGWLHSSEEPRFLARAWGRPQRRYYRFTEAGLQAARERLSRVTADAYVLGLATAAGLSLDSVTPTPTMSDTDRSRHQRRQAWPGVFSKLGHRMPDHPRTQVLDGPHARDAGLDGYTVYFAFCGAPCWEPTEEAQEFPRCPRCRKARRPRSGH